LGSYRGPRSLRDQRDREDRGEQRGGHESGRAAAGACAPRNIGVC
jgi:hypothetical protein